MFENGKLVTKRRRPNPMSVYVFKELTKEFLQEGTLIEFLDTKEKDLIDLHMTVGMFIRNNYIYGQPNPYSLDKDSDFMDEYVGEHPDEISFEMLTSYWDTMNQIRKDEDILDYAYRLTKGKKNDE